MKTFLDTDLPDFTAVLISRSALLKPSAEPVTQKEGKIHASVSLNQIHDGHAGTGRYLSNTSSFSADSVFSLTDGDGGDVLVLFGSEVSNQAAGIVSGHRTHQHWSSRLDLKTNQSHQPNVSLKHEQYLFSSHLLIPQNFLRLWRRVGGWGDVMQRLHYL